MPAYDGVGKEPRVTAILLAQLIASLPRHATGAGHVRAALRAGGGVAL